MRPQNLGLERLEHRPDIQQGVDPIRGDRSRIPGVIADAVPAGDHPARDRFRHRHGQHLLGGVRVEAVETGIGACRGHDRGGDGGDFQPQARQEVDPARGR